MFGRSEPHDGGEKHMLHVVVLTDCNSRLTWTRQLECGDSASSCVRTNHNLHACSHVDAVPPRRFVRLTAVVLVAVQEHALPELAAPIVEELTAQLNEAGAEMTRYRERKLGTTITHMRTERVRPWICTLNLF